ncbi:MAG: hypothetical protein AB7K35_14590 [Pseudorhodoplanes sp.]
MTDTPRRPILRILVIVVAGLQSLLLALYVGFFAVHTASGDALGRKIAVAAAILGSIPLALCALPALILGVRGRLLPLALALCAGTFLIGALFYFYA